MNTPRATNTTRILVCPADTRKPAKSFSTLRNTNISYFLGLDADETQPSSWLAGDRNLTTNGVPLQGGMVDILPNSVVGWTHKMHRGAGNVAQGDGSVQQTTTSRLREMLRIT